MQPIRGGSTVASYVYDAWGNVISSSGSMANINPIRYRGYYYETETGLYYLGSRYYDPAVKRFINADGYASTGQGFVGYNMFAYCNNAPTIYTDSDGDVAAAVTIVTGLIGGISGAFLASADGDNVLAGFLIGAATSVAGLYTNAFGVMAISIAGNIIESIINTPFDSIAWDKLAIEAGISAAIGSYLGKVGDTLIDMAKLDDTDLLAELVLTATNALREFAGEMGIKVVSGNSTAPVPTSSNNTTGQTGRYGNYRCMYKPGGKIIGNKGGAKNSYTSVLY